MEGRHRMLIINICSDELHYLEFVKPVADLLPESRVVHYKELTSSDLKSENIIICGTSLRDNSYLSNISLFSWIKEYQGRMLGICAGFQIISLIYGGKLKNKTEIGYYREEFKQFLGLIGETEVYHLHNNYVTLPKEFEEFTNSPIPQAIKHKEKEIYGVLFHPEVRNKELITFFEKKANTQYAKYLQCLTPGLK